MFAKVFVFTCGLTKKRNDFPEFSRFYTSGQSSRQSVKHILFGHRPPPLKNSWLRLCSQHACTRRWLKQIHSDVAYVLCLITMYTCKTRRSRSKRIKSISAWRKRHLTLLASALGATGFSAWRYWFQRLTMYKLRLSKFPKLTCICRQARKSPS